MTLRKLIEESTSKTELAKQIGISKAALYKVMNGEAYGKEVREKLKTYYGDVYTEERPRDPHERIDAMAQYFAALTKKVETLEKIIDNKEYELSERLRRLEKLVP